MTDAPTTTAALQPAFAPAADAAPSSQDARDLRLTLVTLIVQHVPAAGTVGDVVGYAAALETYINNGLPPTGTVTQPGTVATPALTPTVTSTGTIAMPLTVGSAGTVTAAVRPNPHA